MTADHARWRLRGSLPCLSTSSRRSSRTSASRFQLETASPGTSSLPPSKNLSQDKAVNLKALAEAARGISAKDTEAAVARMNDELKKYGEPENPEKCSVKLDDAGCVHFQLGFWGKWSEHGNQFCSVDIRVSRSAGK
jgi:hypothetical protein